MCTVISLSSWLSQRLEKTFQIQRYRYRLPEAITVMIDGEGIPGRTPLRWWLDIKSVVRNKADL